MPPSVSLPIRPQEIRNPSEHAIGSRFAQNGLAVTRLIVAASDKSPNSHAGRLARLDAANAVLDDEGATWIHPHPFGGVEEEVGRRFTAFHHLRGIEARVEMRREAGQREREGHPIDIAGRGDTMRDLQVLQHRVHPFDWAKRREKRGSTPCPKFGRNLVGNCASQSFIVLEDRSHASSKEQVKRLIDIKADAVSRQRVGETATTQYLAVDQHAVAIENDEIGIGHHKSFPVSFRVYTHCMSNNSTYAAKLCIPRDREGPGGAHLSTPASCGETTQAQHPAVLLMRWRNRWTVIGHLFSAPCGTSPRRSPTDDRPIHGQDRRFRYRG